LWMTDEGVFDGSVIKRHVFPQTVEDFSVGTGVNYDVYFVFQPNIGCVSLSDVAKDEK